MWVFSATSSRLTLDPNNHAGSMPMGKCKKNCCLLNVCFDFLPQIFQNFIDTNVKIQWNFEGN